MWQERRCNHQRQEVWPQEITKREEQQKACPNTSPKPFNNQLSTSQDLPKSRFRGSWGSRIRPDGIPDKVRGPTDVQEGPKNRRREPKSRSRATKGQPSGGQEVAKMAQAAGKPSLASPKRSFQHALCDQLCSKGFWSDLVSFFGLRTKFAICKKPAKT